MTPEEIEDRIKSEYRKHPTLDWAKLAAIKIHSTMKADFTKAMVEYEYNRRKFWKSQEKAGK